MLSFSSLRKVFKPNKNSKRFFLWAVLGLAFSQAVIISTLGLMNGFEKSMKQSINKYLPEINITHRFDMPFSGDDLPFFKNISPSSRVFLFNKLDGFLLKSNESSTAIRNFEMPAREILLKFNINLENENEIIIGDGLAKKLQLSIGDNVTFLSQANDQKSLGFVRKNVKKIISFPLYEQSQRYVFSMRSEDKKFSNQIGIALLDPSYDEILSLLSEIETHIDFNFKATPFWSEFRFLLEAVEVEKKSISIILQVIVIVAIFNVVAFLVYFKEINARKVFLLSALGMSRRRRISAWRRLVLIVWLFACVFSLLFVYFFDLCLKYLPLFELPSKIYYLKRLSLEWGISDILIVFLVSLVVLLAITAFFISKIEQSSILKNLREEFN